MLVDMLTECQTALIRMRRRVTRRLIRIQADCIIPYAGHLQLRFAGKIGLGVRVG